MKLSGYKENYQWFSAKASDATRQIAFAGIGIVWIFSLDRGGAKFVPIQLHLPLFFFCTALLLDLLHYVVAAVTWGTFHRYHEKRRDSPDEDPDLLAPPYLNYPAHILFLTKIGATLIGLFNLVTFLLPGR